MPDFTAHLYKLARAEDDGEDRVYTWRKILREVHDEGFQEGYHAATTDQVLKGQLTAPEADHA